MIVIFFFIDHKPSTSNETERQPSKNLSSTIIKEELQLKKNLDGSFTIHF